MPPQQEPIPLLELLLLLAPLRLELLLLQPLPQLQVLQLVVPPLLEPPPQLEVLLRVPLLLGPLQRLVLLQLEDLHLIWLGVEGRLWLLAII